MLRPTKFALGLSVSVVTLLLSLTLGQVSGNGVATDQANSQAVTGADAPPQTCPPDFIAPDSLAWEVSEGGSCHVLPSEGLLLEPTARPKRGFCRCGCGIRCATSADCGGSPCQAFITCC